MPTRREVLKSACGLAALALGPVLLADNAAAADGITRLPNGKVAVTVAKVPGLAKVGGTVNLGTVKGAPVAVVRTGRSTYAALDLRCTHQGVTVGAASSGWACPAHGSRFAKDGAVTNGPAARPLTKVRSTFNGTVLTVG